MNNDVELIEPECPACGEAVFSSSDLQDIAFAALQRMHAGARFERRQTGQQDARVIDGNKVKMSCDACGHKATRNEIYANKGARK